MHKPSLRIVGIALGALALGGIQVLGELAVQSVGSLEKLGGPMQVTVVFTEPVDPASATVLANYAISGAAITGASMMTGLPAERALGNGDNPPGGRVVGNQCVVLDVMGLSPGAHGLKLSGVKSADLSQTIPSSFSAFVASGYKWTETGTVSDEQYLYGVLTEPALPGTIVAVSDEGFDIFSSGRAQWSNYDEVTFAYKEVTGDFDLAARVEFQDSSSRWARAGIMVRENLNVGENEVMQNTTASRYASMHANPVSCFNSSGPQFDINGANNAFESHFRPATGAETTSMSTAGSISPAYPDAWVRLVRDGNQVSSYVGDGQNWTPVAVWGFAPPLPDTVYVGPSFCPETTNISPYQGSRERLYLAKIRFSLTDTEPPVIENVSASPASLWPANHKLALVAVNYDVADSSGVASSWLSAVSSEPDNGLGDGDTAKDIQLIEGDAHHLYLRAERSGKGNGRVYTVTIHAVDGHGNVSTKDVQVTVARK